MIEIREHDGYFILQGAKFVLCLTRRQFLEGLRQGKLWKRAQQRQARIPSVQEAPCPTSPCPGR